MEKEARTAGSIAARMKRLSAKYVREGERVSQVADKVEEGIKRLGAKPAFPINISFNECAAHDTARPNDERVFKKGDVVKIDLGVHVNGWIADTAYTKEVGSDEHESLIKATEDALIKAEEKAVNGVELRVIGMTIEKAIKEYGYNPIYNLGGHPLRRYQQHGGFIIPNYDNNDHHKLSEALFAIEPFATTGIGYVKNGSQTFIYNLVSERPTRSRMAREILKHIKEEYQTLPFAERWIAKKFKLYKAGIRMLLKEGIIHAYPMLIERSGGIVSQHENTLLLGEKKSIITTEQEN